MTSTLETVQKNIVSAACDAGRPPKDISLIAVSKTKPPGAIRPILDAGQRIFGENKIQEAAAKWPELRQEYDGVELHLIGPLQSNKVRQAVQLFDVIETLDRPKLARAIARICGEEDKSVICYIQVNIGREAQKSGIDPDALDGFVALCRDELMLPVAGLMCIPPSGCDPAPYFIMLRKMAERHGFKELSMGMSADYQTAIACGATSVRVGTALFGARE
ncbi:MAG: YggS family pyridoxal phosphate-dependent enzyme [Alphaproteobacteria bacterium]|nr:MAG: YggS family pyridoxal phosphate-dependent enzyme [Alphaproteobacteria bacterium]